MTFACALLLTLFGVNDDGASSENPINFKTDVLPVLTKAGCNSGACHGAAAGRGGFHLSLFGADSAADFEAIVQDLEGRRVNLTNPDRSLLLAKPTGQLNHGGDVVLDANGPGAKLLLDWIAAGALPGSDRTLVDLEISPRRLLCKTFPARVPIKVTARFVSDSQQDEPPVDVTQWTVLAAVDPGSVEIDADSVAHIRRRGQHVVLARFLDRVVSIQLSVPLFEPPVDHSKVSRENFIDDEVLSVLSALRIPVSPPASDAVWLRRVTLDLTGRLPEPAVAERFIDDTSPEKRRLMVQSLLSSDAFVDYWTLRFAKQLRFHSLPNETEGLRAYHDWLRNEIRKGTGLDQIGYALVTATGDSHSVGPANFVRMTSDARDHAGLFGAFFMGARLGCANCHNHPLDKWTQDDYHGLAAVFSRLERGRHVVLSTRGAVTNLRTNEPAVPRIPGVRYLSFDGDHREELARWAISGNERYFAKVMVNRMWRAMFGKGLVEPSDDLRETNPATHLELFDRLADDFVRHGYSLRHTLELIAVSATYGRSESIPDNAVDRQFYSHSYGRPVMPEVLADAISDVTGVPHSFQGYSAGTRAVMLVDSSESMPTIDVLGRCSLTAGCSDNMDDGGGLATQLHLVNGELINARVASPEGRLHSMISVGRSNEDIISEFYLRATGSRPTVDELREWSARVVDADAAERTKKLEDFMWGLLNSTRFAENR